MDLLSGLNIEQQQAVTAGTGAVLVLAGPGSGKTRVLTHRIAYLISEMGVNPYHILAVTFTNKAAQEMQHRVESMLGGKTRGLMLGTFHAFCARLCRVEAEHLPVDSNFVIFDADDQVNLVKRAIKDLNVDEKRYRPQGVHAVISRAKNDLITADDFPTQDFYTKTVQHVYQRYQQLLLTSNAVDFDDLLLYTTRLFRDNPEVCQKHARRYEYVLVDEFQDTNIVQYELLKYLASFHENVFVVGDADQSIYRWRGADYRNEMRFRQDFPSAQVVILEQNYRSTQNILNLAMAVIDRNVNRTRKRLFTERGEGGKASFYMAADDMEEANYVIETIALLILNKQAKPGDFAVMYRTNAQSRVIEEAFVRAGLPYKVVGAQRFYGRREVKDMIAYLRTVHNPKDEVSLMRVINTPSRRIGTKGIEVLRTESQKMGVSFGEYLLGTDFSQASQINTFGAPAARALFSFQQMLIGWVQLAQTTDPLQLLDRILEDTQYKNYIDDGTDEGTDRWENVMELRRLVTDNREAGLTAILEQIALVSDQDTLTAGDSVPTLLTMHAAKGLEFSSVFIVGLNDGTLPHSRSFDDVEQMMEERRLLYVGITRAMNRLYLSHTRYSNARGFADYAEPSRFLEDIPNTMFENYSLKPKKQTTSVPVSHTAQTSPPVSYDFTKKPVNPPRRVIEKQYQTGLHVIHPLWGEGLVLNSVIEDNEEILDIFFEDKGMKRVIASLAKLKVKI